MFVTDLMYIVVCQGSFSLYFDNHHPASNHSYIFILKLITQFPQTKCNIIQINLYLFQFYVDLHKYNYMPCILIFFGVIMRFINKLLNFNEN